jgi:hypothetical protein
MMPVRELVDTWASIYANSATLRSGVAFMHVGALLGGGGCAVAADLGTLKAWRKGAESLHFELRRLHDVHRIVITSLTLVIASGVLLTAADVDAYLASTAFWTKMALVCALAANGAVLLSTCARAESGDVRAAQRLRGVSVASLVLWFATTLMGAVLPNVL